MTAVLGIDIGGTKIAGGIVTDKGAVLGDQTVPSRAKEGRDAVLGQLSILIGNLTAQATEDITAIGIGTAGEVDPGRGAITSATDNIPGWTGTPLAEICRREWGLPCSVDNDGNAAALGELWFGAGRDFHYFVYISLGTGVGGAVIDGGRLLRGHGNFAAALGHTTIDYGGRSCNCGSTGCLETYVSGTAVTALARELGAADSGRELLQKARAQDLHAQTLMEDIGRYLGVGLANFVNLFNPEAIVVGGGLGEAGDLLLRPAEVTMNQRVLQGLRGRTRLLATALGNRAGFMGGAVLALSSLGRARP